MASFAVNRKARHEYHIISTLEVGIVLLGTEVKAIRAGNVNIQDAYVSIDDGELTLINAHVGDHPNAREKHDPRRHRRLLAHHREIVKFAQEIERKGMTIIPLDLYEAHGKVKLSIAVGKGKDQADKRESAKKADWQREKARLMREMG